MSLGVFALVSEKVVTSGNHSNHFFGENRGSQGGYGFFRKCVFPSKLKGNTGYRVTGSNPVTHPNTMKAPRQSPRSLQSFVVFRLRAGGRRGRSERPGRSVRPPGGCECRALAVSAVARGRHSTHLSGTRECSRAIKGGLPALGETNAGPRGCLGFLGQCRFAYRTGLVLTPATSLTVPAPPAFP